MFAFIKYHQVCAMKLLILNKHICRQKKRIIIDYFAFLSCYTIIQKREKNSIHQFYSQIKEFISSLSLS